MTKEQVINESIRLLNSDMISYHKAQTIIKVMCYFAYKTKSYEINFSNVDFSEHMKFNRAIEEIAGQQSKLKNYKTSELLLDVVVRGPLEHNKDLNKIFNMLVELKPNEIFEIMEDVNEAQTSLDNFSYTDSKVSDLVYQVAKNNEAKNIIDLCCGEACELSRFAKESNDLYFYGYEPYTVSQLIGRLKLDMLGQKNVDIAENDVIAQQLEPKYDVVLCHAPWGMRYEKELADDINPKIEFKEKKKGRSDWLFISKAINAMSEHGKAYVLTTESSLFSNQDIYFKKQAIEQGYLETVISLPSGTIMSTNVNYSLLVFSNNNKKVKFVNADEAFIGTVRNKKVDIDKILDLLNNCKDEKLVRIVDLNDIIKNDYNISVSRYVTHKPIVNLVNPKKIKEVAKVIAGYQYSSRSLEELSHNKGNVSIVKMSNIADGNIAYDELVSANIEDDKIKKYLLQENDILVSTKGAKTKVALVNNLNNQCIIPQVNLTIIRCNEKLINPTYLYAFLNSEVGMNILDINKKGAVIPNLSTHDLENIEIPLVDEDTQEVMANRFIKMNKRIIELKSEIEKIEEKLLNIYTDEVGE